MSVQADGALIFFEQNFPLPVLSVVIYIYSGDRGSTLVKVLCYKSEGRWFDPSWCQWIFH